MKLKCFATLLFALSGLTVFAAGNADFTYTVTGTEVCTTPTFSSDWEYYSWNFGGTSQGLNNNCYDFNNYGTYSVSLEVIWDDGSTTTVTKNVSVICVAPSGDFTYTRNGLYGVDFSATATNPVAGPTYYTWYFGNGVFKSGANVYYQYSSFGNKTVKLTISNSCGATDVITKTFHLDPP